MSNQKQVDALSAQDYWNISHAVTRLFAEAPDERPPTQNTTSADNSIGVGCWRILDRQRVAYGPGMRSFLQPDTKFVQEL